MTERINRRQVSSTSTTNYYFSSTSSDPFSTANFGGVFSLFIGLSFVSFIEIGIFFTVHLHRIYKEEVKNAVKVESFSKRTENHDVRQIQEKVMKELQRTLDKY